MPVSPLHFFKVTQDEDKNQLQTKKEEIQKRFKDETGLRVDVILQGKNEVENV